MMGSGGKFKWGRARLVSAFLALLLVFPVAAIGAEECSLFGNRETASQVLAKMRAHGVEAKQAAKAAPDGHAAAATPPPALSSKQALNYLNERAAANPRATPNSVVEMNEISGSWQRLPGVAAGEPPVSVRKAASVPETSPAPATKAPRAAPELDSARQIVRGPTADLLKEGETALVQPSRLVASQPKVGKGLLGHYLEKYTGTDAEAAVKKATGMFPNPKNPAHREAYRASVLATVKQMSAIPRPGFVGFDLNNPGRRIVMIDDATHRSAQVHMLTNASEWKNLPSSMRKWLDPQDLEEFGKHADVQLNVKVLKVYESAEEMVFDMARTGRGLLPEGLETARDFDSIAFRESREAALRAKNVGELAKVEREALMQGYAKIQKELATINDDPVRSAVGYLFDRYPGLSEAGKNYVEFDVGRAFADPSLRSRIQALSITNRNFDSPMVQEALAHYLFDDKKTLDGFLRPLARPGKETQYNKLLDTIAAERAANGSAEKVGGILRKAEAEDTVALARKERELALLRRQVHDDLQKREDAGRVQGSQLKTILTAKEGRLAEAEEAVVRLQERIQAARGFVSTPTAGSELPRAVAAPAKINGTPAEILGRDPFKKPALFHADSSIVHALDEKAHLGVTVVKTDGGYRVTAQNLLNAKAGLESKLPDGISGGIMVKVGGKEIDPAKAFPIAKGDKIEIGLHGAVLGRYTFDGTAFHPAGAGRVANVFDLSRFANDPAFVANVKAGKEKWRPFSPDAKTSSFSELHSHLTGAIEADSLVGIGLKRGVAYPGELLREALGMRKDAPPRPGWLMRGDDVDLRSLSSQELNRLISKMKISPEVITSFEGQLNDIYRFRRPFSTSPDTFADLLHQSAKELRDSGVSFVQFSHSSQHYTPEFMAMLEKELPKIERETGVRVQMMFGILRTKSVDEIVADLETFKAMKSQYVVGIDFLGEETQSLSRFQNTPIPTKIREILAEKPEAQIRFHAGESPKFPENVRIAVELGANRIGHGTFGFLGESAKASVLAIKKAADETPPRKVFVELQRSSNISLDYIRKGHIVNDVDTVLKESGIEFGPYTDGHGIYGSTTRGEFAVGDQGGNSLRSRSEIRASERKILADGFAFEARQLERRATELRAMPTPDTAAIAEINSRVAVLNARKDLANLMIKASDLVPPAEVAKGEHLDWMVGKSRKLLDLETKLKSPDPAVVAAAKADLAVIGREVDAYYGPRPTKQGRVLAGEPTAKPAGRQASLAADGAEVNQHLQTKPNADGTRTYRVANRDYQVPKEASHAIDYALNSGNRFIAGVGDIEGNTRFLDALVAEGILKKGRVPFSNKDFFEGYVFTDLARALAKDGKLELQLMGDLVNGDFSARMLKNIQFWQADLLANKIDPGPVVHTLIGNHDSAKLRYRTFMKENQEGYRAWLKGAPDSATKRVEYFLGPSGLGLGGAFNNLAKDFLPLVEGRRAGMKISDARVAELARGAAARWFERAAGQADGDYVRLTQHPNSYLGRLTEFGGTGGDPKGYYAWTHSGITDKNIGKTGLGFEAQDLITWMDALADTKNKLGQQIVDDHLVTLFAKDSAKTKSEIVLTPDNFQQMTKRERGVLERAAKLNPTMADALKSLKGGREVTVAVDPSYATILTLLTDSKYGVVRANPERLANVPPKVLDEMAAEHREIREFIERIKKDGYAELGVNSPSEASTVYGVRFKDAGRANLAGVAPDLHTAEPKLVARAPVPPGTAAAMMEKAGVKGQFVGHTPVQYAMFVRSGEPGVPPTFYLDTTFQNHRPPAFYVLGDGRVVISNFDTIEVPRTVNGKTVIEKRQVRIEAIYDPKNPDASGPVGKIHDTKDGPMNIVGVAYDTETGQRYGYLGAGLENGRKPIVQIPSESEIKLARFANPVESMEELELNRSSAILAQKLNKGHVAGETTEYGLNRDLAALNHQMAGGRFRQSTEEMKRLVASEVAQGKQLHWIAGGANFAAANTGDKMSLYKHYADMFTSEAFHRKGNHPGHVIIFGGTNTGAERAARDAFQDVLKGQYGAEAQAAAKKSRWIGRSNFEQALDDYLHPESWDISRDYLLIPRRAEHEAANGGAREGWVDTFRAMRELFMHGVEEGNSPSLIAKRQALGVEGPTVRVAGGGGVIRDGGKELIDLLAAEGKKPRFSVQLMEGAGSSDFLLKNLPQSLKGSPAVQTFNIGPERISRLEKALELKEVNPERLAAGGGPVLRSAAIDVTDAPLAVRGLGHEEQFLWKAAKEGKTASREAGISVEGFMNVARENAKKAGTPFDSAAWLKQNLGSVAPEHRHFYDPQTGRFVYPVQSPGLAVENGGQPLMAARINYVSPKPNNFSKLLNANVFEEHLGDFVRPLSSPRGAGLMHKVPEMELLITVNKAEFAQLKGVLDQIPDPSLRSRIKVFDTTSKTSLWAQDGSKPLSTGYYTLIQNDGVMVTGRPSYVQTTLAMEPTVRPTQSIFNFEGGNIIVGRDHLFIGTDIVQNQMSRFNISRVEALEALKNEFGGHRKVVEMGALHPSGSLEQAAFHVDLNMAVVRDLKNGGDVVALQSPAKFLEVYGINDLMNKDFAAFASQRDLAVAKINANPAASAMEKTVGSYLAKIDEKHWQKLVQEQLQMNYYRMLVEKEGLRAVDVPGTNAPSRGLSAKGPSVLTEKDAFPFYNYTNLVASGRVVAMPQLDLAADAMAQKVFRELGYEIHPTHAPKGSLCLMGGTRCMTETYRVDWEFRDKVASLNPVVDAAYTLKNAVAPQPAAGPVLRSAAIDVTDSRKLRPLPTPSRFEGSVEGHAVAGARTLSEGLNPASKDAMAARLKAALAGLEISEGQKLDLTLARGSDGHSYRLGSRTLSRADLSKITTELADTDLGPTLVSRLGNRNGRIRFEIENSTKGLFVKDLGIDPSTLVKVVKVERGEVAFIGYGSLLDSTSMERSLKRPMDSSKVFNVELDGWKRTRDVFMPNEAFYEVLPDGSKHYPKGIAYYNIQPDDAARMNAKLFVIPEEDLAKFDRREWIYDGKNVADRVLGVKVEGASDRVIAYVGKPEYTFDVKNPGDIRWRASYDATVSQGLNGTDAEFRKGFQASTSEHSPPTIKDVLDPTKRQMSEPLPSGGPVLKSAAIDFGQKLSGTAPPPLRWTKGMPVSGPSRNWIPGKVKPGAQIPATTSRGLASALTSPVLSRRTESYLDRLLNRNPEINRFTKRYGIPPEEFKKGAAKCFR